MEGNKGIQGGGWDAGKDQVGKLRHTRTLEIGSGGRKRVSFTVVLILPGAGLSVFCSSCV